ncbi:MULTISPECIES: glycosyltransferase family 4 protein [Micromonospora]|uniref:Glycosyltransferase family 1 protein n=2 Tax=Micromonospora TaxID=1873 RepID=A0A372FRX0_9ACTN|nr:MULTISPECIES: glycosyltransferase family 4 protein [Micromonospora]QOC93482.1 glycosyltransferase family 4 protein [Micromonospora craniellae]RFS43473.1 glycosyltransferase family 1 protein [Micromonospora craniellae]RIV30249.1 glycosyltransferase family 1 protein [Micromonospora radicis]
MPHALLLAPWFPPCPGGAERYAYRLYEQAVRNGWTITVATDGHTRSLREAVPALEEGVYRLTRYKEQLSDNRRVTWRSMQFSVLDELHGLLDGLRPIDLVHANSIETAVLGRIVADHHDVPLVVTIHEHAPQTETFGRGRLRLAFHRLAPDAVIAPSSFYYERARAQGVPLDRVHLIPHGVEVPPVVPARPSTGHGPAWGLPEDTWVAVSVGRIYRPKGTLELIRAAAIARRRAPQLRVVIVGPDGPSEYARAAREEARRLNLGEVVRFAGPRRPEEMPAVLWQADAIVAPSLAEGFGLAVAEGMGLGKPVVATAVGGLADLVADGVNGEVVTPGDPESLADALTRLATDPERCARLGAAARRSVLRRHHVATMVAETTALYASLVMTARQSPATVSTLSHNGP